MKEVWLRKDETLDLHTIAELVKLDNKEIRVHRIGKATLRFLPNGPEPVAEVTRANVVALRANSL